MAVADRITYRCKDCQTLQSSYVKSPLAKCQAYWKGRPCRGELLQLDPKPQPTGGSTR